MQLTVQPLILSKAYFALPIFHYTWNSQWREDYINTSLVFTAAHFLHSHLYYSAAENHERKDGFW